MSQSISKDSVPVLTVIKDIAIVGLSIIAIIVSIWTCSEQSDSNDLASDANNLAKNANMIALQSKNTASEANQLAIEANDLARASNKLASDANRLSKETSETARNFDKIEAANTWDQRIDSYFEIDGKILRWEESQKLKRDGTPVESITALETRLAKLNVSVPNEITRLYVRRHEKYKILQKMSEEYEPFKEWLAHIDFTLPAAPSLPTVTMSGVSITGGSIN